MKPYATHMHVSGSNAPLARRLIIWTACGQMLVMPYGSEVRYSWTDAPGRVTCLRCKRAEDRKRRAA